MNFAEYKRPIEIEEAYRILKSDRKAVIIGGGAYLRLHKRNVNIGIDLSDSNLDFIKVNHNALEIGAMTTLRNLETNENTSKLFGESISKIAGVPIRNIATIGGSICGKYPFSDILPTLLVLNAKLKFHDKGVVNLSDYLKSESSNDDILMEVIIPNKDMFVSAKCFKLTYNDFSISSLAVGEDNGLSVAIGARPGKAVVLCMKSNEVLNEDTVSEVAKQFVNSVEFASDYRGSEAYRKNIAFELLKEALMEVILWK